MAIPLETTYVINEIFYSLQGEGARAGAPSVFLRFSGCNLQCDGAVTDDGVMSPICDTEFASGEKLTLPEIEQRINSVVPVVQPDYWIILTGGEPTLQADDLLCHYLKACGHHLAIETNGLKPVSSYIEWVSVSPKTAEHTLKQRSATELRYIRAEGQAIPKPSIPAQFKFISPHFDPSSPAQTARNLQWCIDLVKKYPQWRLSVQMHKLWSVR